MAHCLAPWLAGPPGCLLCLRECATLQGLRTELGRFPDARPSPKGLWGPPSQFANRSGCIRYPAKNSHVGLLLANQFPTLNSYGSCFCNVRIWRGLRIVRRFFCLEIFLTKILGKEFDDRSPCDQLLVFLFLGFFAT